MEIGEFQVASLSLLLWDSITLEPDFITEVTIALCDRLQEEHNRGRPYGALHPDNVVFSISSGRISHLRLDEPLKETEDDEKEGDLIFAQRVYRSPEQTKGLPACMQSDVYAIGQIMNIALTGVPLQGRKKRLYTREGDGNPGRSERKLARLERIIRFCTAYNPPHRYADLRDLKGDLRRVRDDLPPLGPSHLPHRSAPRIRWTLALVQLLAITSILWISSWINVGMSRESPPVVETIWSKAAKEYHFGDQFSLTIVPKEKCYCYLFYTCKLRSSISLYPSRNQGLNTISPSAPLPISTLGRYSLTVDDDPSGKLVVLSIRDGARGKWIKDKVLSASDWDQTEEPKDHWLKLSETALLDRIKQLKAEYPSDVYYSIETAPTARRETQHSISRQASNDDGW